MKYANLDYNEMIALLNRLMPPLKDQDYDFCVETANTNLTVCVTAHRFNKFPEIFPDVFPKRD